jgi:hypothetical protein
MPPALPHAGHVQIVQADSRHACRRRLSREKVLVDGLPRHALAHHWHGHFLGRRLAGQHAVLDARSRRDRFRTDGGRADWQCAGKVDEQVQCVDNRDDLLLEGHWQRVSAYCARRHGRTGPCVSLLLGTADCLLVFLCT